MVKRLLILVSLLLLVMPSLGVAQAAGNAAKHRPIRPRPITPITPVLHGAGATSGTLTAINGMTLTVTTASGPLTVTVTPATRIVRLFGGPSGLDEMSPGDALVVRGSTVVSGTITATLVRDESIQDAFTRLKGAVQAVGATTVTVMVGADTGHQSPFGLGQSLSLNIGVATKIISPTTTGTQVFTGTAGLSVLAGAQVTVLGTYNRVQNAFTTVNRIVIAKTSGVHMPSPKQVSGTLVGLFGITAPATLTLQTTNMGLITVTVAATPTISIVRRYNGPSGLDQLVPGDRLIVHGSFSDATTFAATNIQDVSIQAADTAATVQITGVVSATNSFTGTITHDANSVRTPFDEGTAVTVTVSSITKILVPATPPVKGEVFGSFANLAGGQKVTVMGIYNRKLHTYTITHLVRVHKA